MLLSCSASSSGCINNIAVPQPFACGCSESWKKKVRNIENAIYYLKMVLAEADETTKEYLDIINDEAKNAGDVITGLLEITRTRAAERGG